MYTKYILDTGEPSPSCIADVSSDSGLGESAGKSLGPLSSRRHEPRRDWPSGLSPRLWGPWGQFLQLDTTLALAKFLESC